MGASRRIIVFEDFCCYDAGKIVREVAKVTGGGGGGKPNMAQAGGKDKSNLDEALRIAKGLI